MPRTQASQDPTGPALTEITQTIEQILEHRQDVLAGLRASPTGSPERKPLLGELAALDRAIDQALDELERLVPPDGPPIAERFSGPDVPENGNPHALGGGVQPDAAIQYGSD